MPRPLSDAGRFAPDGEDRDFVVGDIANGIIRTALVVGSFWKFFNMVSCLRLVDLWVKAEAKGRVEEREHVIGGALFSLYTQHRQWRGLV
jgi:hypothetical protein